jgi:hypothetical protein
VEAEIKWLTREAKEEDVSGVCRVVGAPAAGILSAEPGSIPGEAELVEDARARTRLSGAPPLWIFGGATR